MKSINEKNYSEFFCHIFNLLTLQEAVGKEVILTEDLKLFDHGQCCRDAKRIDTLEKTLIVLSATSYNKDDFEYVTVVLSDETSIDFSFPFFPSTIQMSYSGYGESKVLSKSSSPFAQKTMHCLKFFRMNGGRTGPTLAES